MDVLHTLLHIACYLLAALALALPRLRTAAIVVLAVAALAGIVHGALDAGERTLTTVHTYAAYAGSDLDISMVAFPTGERLAPGWQWPLPFALFAAAWIAVLRVLGPQPVRRPLLLPLALAWSATASWLGMQWLAAPAMIVQPVGLDRFLWPAGLATALLAARSAGTFLGLFVRVGGAVMAARLPAALFSKYASDTGLGTCLDISTVRGIVNPMTQMQFDPQLEPGSAAQQFWLIWLEHVIFFPAVYVMSLFGIAFGAWMYHRHAGDAGRAPGEMPPPGPGR